MGGLQTEKPLIPKKVMREANILNPEFVLPRLPFLRPGEMGFIELLAKFGNFDLVRDRKNNSRHGDPASWSDRRKPRRSQAGAGQRPRQDRLLASFRYTEGFLAA